MPSKNITSVLFFSVSVLLILKVLSQSLRRPQKINLLKNRHSREFFIANAGASLRMSFTLSVTWMVIANKLYLDHSAWGTFLDQRIALEFLAIISLFLCAYGVMGVRHGRCLSVSEGEEWRFWSSANILVTLYCLTTICAYVFGFAYHFVIFYSSSIME